MEIPVADDPAVEKPHIVVVVVTTGALPVIVEKKRSRRRLLVATTMAHLNFSGGSDRDHRHGGPDATTTDDPRDGSSRADEITLIIDHEATIECTTAVGATSDGHGSHIAATMAKKLRDISRSSGANRSPAAARRRKRF